jgi:trigger factor
MQVSKSQVDPTTIKLTVSADQSLLDATKQHVLADMSRDVKVPGFRPGKAPTNLIEKQIDQSLFQAQFLDHAINQLYVDAAKEQNLRPVAQPEITITKFVPFTTLEFTAQVTVVGEIKLPDYKKIKVSKPAVSVTSKDVDEVLQNLSQRSAQKTPVERAAKKGDEMIIDFTGTDAKTGEPIPGADGKAYPLTLGSNAFIPGFEDELVGAKPGALTKFTLTFPKDYGAKELQNRQVTFAVTVHTVNELQPPKLDDAFAAAVGPFKTLAELKADIKKQLTAERNQEAQRTADNELLERIAAKTVVAIPESLIEEEITRMEEEEKRSVAYSGQTWQEHLQLEGLTADEHRAKQRPGAELRIKGGLILGEIADRENITVTPEELEVRLMLLKNQYPDEAMQAEIDKPENRRDINNRLLTEKTLDKLRNYAAKA